MSIFNGQFAGCFLALMLSGSVLAGAAAEGGTTTALAVLEFEAADDGLQQRALLLTDLVAASVSGDERFVLLERDHLGKIFAEQELAAAQSAAERQLQTGRLLGAQYLLVGRLHRDGRRLALTCRLLEVATGRAIIHEADADAEADHGARPLADGIGAWLKKIAADGQLKTLPADDEPMSAAAAEFKFNQPLTVSVSVEETTRGNAIEPLTVGKLLVSQLELAGWKTQGAWFERLREKPKMALFIRHEYAGRNGPLVAWRTVIEAHLSGFPASQKLPPRLTVSAVAVAPPEAAASDHAASRAMRDFFRKLTVSVNGQKKS